MLEESCEAGELGVDGGFLYTGGYVGAKKGPVKGLVAGAYGIVGEAETWGSGDADEFIVLGGAPGGVKDAVLDVALDLEGVEVVGALDDTAAGICGVEEASALVLVLEAEERGDAVRKDVVGLIVELVAVGDGVEGGEDEGCLASGGVAVRSAKSKDVAVVGGLGDAVDDGCDGLACGAELLDLFALAGDAVAGDVVPVPCQRVFDGEARVDVLIGLLAGGRDAVDIVCARQANGGVGASEGEAGCGVGDDAVADVRDAVCGVVLVEREGVGGVEAVEGSEVVEVSDGAGEDGFVAIGVEVARVACVVEGGTKGRRCVRWLN